MNPTRRIFDLQVIMEDKPDEPILVTTDQRDSSAFELWEHGTSYARSAGMIDTFMRYTAWHALTRTKRIKITWEKFNATCTFAGDAPPPPPAPAAAGEVDDETPLGFGQ
jgi:hypothetical protein